VYIIEETDAETCDGLGRTYGFVALLALGRLMFRGFYFEFSIWQMRTKKRMTALARNKGHAINKTRTLILEGFTHKSRLSWSPPH
jgi:hypothetical protein